MKHVLYEKPIKKNYDHKFLQDEDENSFKASKIFIKMIVRKIKFIHYEESNEYIVVKKLCYCFTKAAVAYLTDNDLCAVWYKNNISTSSKW